MGGALLRLVLALSLLPLVVAAPAEMEGSVQELHAKLAEKDAIIAELSSRPHPHTVTPPPNAKAVLPGKATCAREQHLIKQLLHRDMNRAHRLEERIQQQYSSFADAATEGQTAFESNAFDLQSLLAPQGPDGAPSHPGESDEVDGAPNADRGGVSHGIAELESELDQLRHNHRHQLPEGFTEGQLSAGHTAVLKMTGLPHQDPVEAMTTRLGEALHEEHGHGVFHQAR